MRILLFVASGILLCQFALAGTNGDWPTYANDRGSSKYSPLNQINKSNVDRLKVLWRWTSPDQSILAKNPNLFAFINEATPLAIDGALLTENIDLTLDAYGMKVLGASGNAYGALMTYTDDRGRQIIVVPVGGANFPAELVALTVQ